MSAFPTALSAAADRVEARLQAEIATLPPSMVRDAMAYAARGGKKLRGFLVLESARLHGIGPEQAVASAAAIEAIHAYSLVHDDLPAMDDDDLRRGQPTVHVKWDEATAILTGDALQTLAFGLLARPDAAPTDSGRLALLATLAHASWRGRHGAGAGAGHCRRNVCDPAGPACHHRAASGQDRRADRMVGLCWCAHGRGRPCAAC